MSTTRSLRKWVGGSQNQAFANSYSVPASGFSVMNAIKELKLTVENTSTCKGAVSDAGMTRLSGSKTVERSTIHIERYTNENRAEWNDFVKNSKNGTFLFHRDYMQYHAARFADCSLLFRNEKGNLIAILPGDIKESAFTSHGGLTYGGVISSDAMKTGKMLEVFEKLIEFTRSNGLSRIIYKAVPHIYHIQPSEEDLYALFRYNAKLVRRDVSTSIYTKVRPSISNRRTRSINKSHKNEVEVRESTDFEVYMQLAAEVLAAKYNVVPVHTADEMRLLADRFPDNIKLFGGFYKGEMLAGVIIYKSQTVAHVQYMAANDKGKSMSALDAVLQYLITHYYADMKYFDLGISTEQQGKYLNSGLIEYKESWGGRATAYDTYEIVVA